MIQIVVQIIIAVLSIAASIGVALLTTKLTVKNEKKQLVYAERKNTYAEVYKHLSKLNIDPTLIYDAEFMDALFTLSVRMDIYAEDSIKDKFDSFYKDSQSKYDKYKEKYLYEDAYDERESIRQAVPDFVGEFLDKEEDDYKIYNLCDLDMLKNLMTELKNELAKE